jgi:prevent-host-death family protein
VYTIGLSEAKKKLCELVARASEGQRIGITRRGKLAAMIVPAQFEGLAQRSLRGNREDQAAGKIAEAARLKSLLCLTSRYSDGISDGLLKE